MTNKDAVKNDDDKLRMDLVPVHPFLELVFVYTMGAKKYTEYGECKCVYIAKEMYEYMPKIVVDVVMKEILGSKTLNFMKDKKLIVENGDRITYLMSELKREKEVENLENNQIIVEKELHENIVSLSKNIMLSSKVLVAFVEILKESVTSIIATQQVKLEDLYVYPATLVSALLKSGGKSGLEKHCIGCPGLEIIRSGDRNWEKGFKWSRVWAPMMRHGWNYWRGEKFDRECLNTDCRKYLPIEATFDREMACPYCGTGGKRQHHLASVAWNAFALMEYEDTHVELDDRPRKAV